MSYNTFPTFIGAAWEIKKRVILSSVLETADSGSEFITSKWSLPHFEFDLTWNYLSQADRDTLEAFIIQQLGPAIPFLLTVVNDSTKTGVPLTGTTNGTNVNFQISGLPAQTYVTSCVAYRNGSPVGVTSFTPTGAVVLAVAPPGSGTSTMTVDCVYAYVVRFPDDAIEFNQLWNQAYEQTGITFRTRR